MPRELVKVKTVYKFDELSESSQQAAIESYRNNNLDYEWWDEVYQNVEDAAKILGIEISDRNGGNSKEIYFSGFYHQGSGSCFSGDYSYAKGSIKAIKTQFPSDTTLHKIAADLQAVQAKEAYKLWAEIKANDRYQSLNVSVYHSDYQYKDLKDGSEDGITKALNDFNNWIYSSLESEYEYLNSDEQIRESILCNEYEFTESGVMVS